jgi:hypothetical protein
VGRPRDPGPRTPVENVNARVHSLLLPDAGTPEQVERRVQIWAARRLGALPPTRGIVGAQRWLSGALASDRASALAALGTTEVLESLIADTAPETLALRRPPPRPPVVIEAPWPKLSAHVRGVGDPSGLGVAGSSASHDLVVAAVEARVRLLHAMTPLIRARGRIRAGHPIEVGRALARCTALSVVAAVTDRGHAEAAAALSDLSIGARPTPAGEAHWNALHAATTKDSRPRLLCVDLDFDDFVYSEAVSRALVREAASAGWAVDWIRPHPADRLRLEAELGEMPDVEFAGTEWWLRDVGEVRELADLASSATAVFGNLRPPEWMWLATAAPTLPWVVWARHLEWTLRQLSYPPVSLKHLHMWVMATPFGYDLESYTRNVHYQFWPMELDRLSRERSVVCGRVFGGGDSGRDHGVLLEAVEGTELQLVLVTSNPGPPHPNVTHTGRLPLTGFCDAIAEAEIVAIPLVGYTRSIGLTVLALAMLMGRAVVATRNAHIEHYANDGEHVVLVPEGDALALRAALLDLHTDHAKRERIGRAARERALRDFDVRQMAAAMMAAIHAELAANEGKI